MERRSPRSHRDLPTVTSLTLFFLGSFILIAASLATWTRGSPMGAATAEPTWVLSILGAALIAFAWFLLGNWNGLRSATADVRWSAAWSTMALHRKHD